MGCGFILSYTLSDVRSGAVWPFWPCWVRFYAVSSTIVKRDFFNFSKKSSLPLKPQTALKFEENPAGRRGALN